MAPNDFLPFYVKGLNNVPRLHRLTCAPLPSEGAQVVLKKGRKPWQENCLFKSSR